MKYAGAKLICESYLKEPKQKNQNLNGKFDWEKKQAKMIKQSKKAGTCRD